MYIYSEPDLAVSPSIQHSPFELKYIELFASQRKSGTTFLTGPAFFTGFSGYTAETSSFTLNKSLPASATFTVPNTNKTANTTTINFFTSLITVLCFVEFLSVFIINLKCEFVNPPCRGRERLNLYAYIFLQMVLR